MSAPSRTPFNKDHSRIRRELVSGDPMEQAPPAAPRGPERTMATPDGTFHGRRRFAADMAVFALVLQILAPLGQVAAFASNPSLAVNPFQVICTKDGAVTGPGGRTGVPAAADTCSFCVVAASAAVPVPDTGVPVPAWTSVRFDPPAVRVRPAGAPRAAAARGPPAST